MGQQISQNVHRFTIAHSCLLWKQRRNRSSWYTEEMRSNIWLRVPTAQAPLVLPGLGCVLGSAGEPRWLFSRLQSIDDCLPFVSVAQQRQLVSAHGVLLAAHCSASPRVSSERDGKDAEMGGIRNGLATVALRQRVMGGKQTAWKAPKCCFHRQAS